MCSNNGYGRGSTTGYAWARGIATVVIALLFIAVVWAASHDEESRVLMTPYGGCVMAGHTSTDNYFIAKHGRGSDCETKHAVVWVEETEIHQRVFFQIDDEELLCMTDKCAGQRETCAVSHITFDSCVEEARNQLWTRPLPGSKVSADPAALPLDPYQYMSVAALEDKRDVACCLTGATTYRSVMNNENVLWMDQCKGKNALGSFEQQWKFFDEPPPVVEQKLSVSGSSSSSYSLSSSIKPLL